WSTPQLSPVGVGPRTRQQHPERSRDGTREFLDAMLRGVDLNVGASSIESGAPMTGTPTSKPDRSGGVGTIDRTHLLLVGARPGLGEAVAHSFAIGSFRVTLVARSNDKLADLAGGLADTGAEIGTIEADAS